MLATAYLTLLVALTISGTAIFYSVTGLTAIFAAAVIPIVVMGTALEVAKLVAAVWLHRHWHEAPRYIRAYLSFAVVVLMFITSIGIFGFLSKAHIEQTAASGTQAAKLERIDADIERQRDLIARAKTRIEEVRSETDDATRGANNRMADARAQIREIRDAAAERITDQQQAIDRARERVAERIAPYEEKLAQVDQQVAQLDQVIQGLIEMDYLSRAQERQAEQKPERERLAERRAEIVAKIEEVRSAPRPDAERARARIEQIRGDEKADIAVQRKIIERLSNPRATADADEADRAEAIERQRERIADARTRIDTLNETKFAIESEIRKLEAEVGPLKYIAAFIYDDATDKDMLEESVRWVIIVIISVFDPLAVLMLIASQWSFMQHRAQAGFPVHGAAAARAEPVPTPEPARQAPRPTPTSRPNPPQPTTGSTPQQNTAPPDTGASAQTDQPGYGDDDPDAQLKTDLLERARAGKRKPAAKAKGDNERALADALARFTDPSAQGFDRTFTQELRQIAPATWISSRGKGR